MYLQDGLVVCPECGHKLFKEESVFAIMKTTISQNNTISYSRIPYKKVLCAKCGSELNIEEE